MNKQGVINLIGEDVKIIEYSSKVDFGNCLTHSVGAFLSVFGIIALCFKAEGTREFFACLIYGFSLLAVYSVSAVYHGLKPGEAKRRARILDHATVPVLIAGTATPCALITLHQISAFHSIFVFVLAWGCTIFGMVSKIFFFEKLKVVTMTVYIASSALMLLSVVPILDKINMGGFRLLLLGCAFYLIGAVLCALGIKRPFLHVIFHVFIMLGSAVHYYAIYTVVI